jgi:hypothetical protein
MTDPALIGHLRILEAKLDRLTAALERIARALEADIVKPEEEEKKP